MEAIFLEQGTLQFHVFASNAYLPIEGATIVVQSASVPPKLLAIRITDKSGETSPVKIETPSRSDSQTPGSTQQPWTNVTVLLEHPRFERLTLRSVQVFPGVTSLQNIEMTPVLEFDPEYSGAQELQFTPQQLWEGSK